MRFQDRAGTLIRCSIRRRHEDETKLRRLPIQAIRGPCGLASEQSRGVLEGHSISVDAVAFSPDGKLLASASYDKTVWLWDIKTTKAIQKLSTERPIHDLSFSNDGSYLKTECGLLKLNSLGSVGLLQSEFPSYLSVKKQWVTCRKEIFPKMHFDKGSSCPTSATLLGLLIRHGVSTHNHAPPHPPIDETLPSLLLFVCRT
jgi:hypothetical protein